MKRRNLTKEWQVFKLQTAPFPLLQVLTIWLLFGGLLASHRHDWLPIILLGERITRWFVAAAQDQPHQAIRMANMAQDVVEDLQPDLT